MRVSTSEPEKSSSRIPDDISQFLQQIDTWSPAQYDAMVTALRLRTEMEENGGSSDSVFMEMLTSDDEEDPQAQEALKKAMKEQMGIFKRCRKEGKRPEIDPLKWWRKAWSEFLKRCGYSEEKVKKKMQSSELSPRNDAIFKFIWTDPQNKKLLVAFLNALHISDEPIEDFEYLNVEKRHGAFLNRKVIFDILIRTNTGIVIDIEMQKKVEDGLQKRLIAYWANNFLQQIPVGADFKNVKKTVGIYILNGSIFKNPGYNHQVSDLCRQDGEEFSGALDLRVLELEKSRTFQLTILKSFS